MESDNNWKITNINNEAILLTQKKLFPDEPFINKYTRLKLHYLYNDYNYTCDIHSYRNNKELLDWRHR